MESSVAGRRRVATRHSAEDQALDQIAKEVNYLFILPLNYYSASASFFLLIFFFFCFISKQQQQQKVTRVGYFF